jgi:hypothetical protein
MHTDFLCILYYITRALHVSGAICTHHQEYKLQSTAVGTRDCYGVLEVGQSIGAGCGRNLLQWTAQYICYQDVRSHEHQKDTTLIMQHFH